MEDLEMMDEKERLEFLRQVIFGEEKTSEKLKALEIMNKMLGEQAKRAEEKDVRIVVALRDD